jgi:hypothetical protein
MLLRTERKYLVPNHRMDALRERISSFVHPDGYAVDNGNGYAEYTVRSIYFDSKNLACYAQKHEGVMFRRKFRIRGYNKLSKGCSVFLEVKRKIEARQKKYRSLVRFEDVGQMLENGDLEQYIIPCGDRHKALKDAGKFMYHIKKGQLIPTCLVVYEREPYHGKMDHGVRITFDKNIRSRIFTPVSSLYEEQGLKPLFSNHFILEIKYFNHVMPVWARSVVQEFRLRNDALSKYTLGIDINREKILMTY